MEDEQNSYTREDLRVMHYTGRSTSHGYGRDKITSYRSGVQTKAGDLEEREWLKEAEALVAREGGAAELASLIKTASTLPWLHNDKAIRVCPGALYDEAGRNAANETQKIHNGEGEIKWESAESAA